VLAKLALERLGAEPVLWPIVIDDRALVEAALDEALATCDVVVLSGGSSKGSEDFTSHLLEERGDLITHGVLAAPGRPTVVAVINGKPVINTSGPMLAFYYESEWLLRPIVAHALGTPRALHQTVQAILDEDIALKPTATGEVMSILHRMELTRDANGVLHTRQLPGGHAKTGPALLGDAQLQHDEDTPVYHAGDMVEVELLYPPEFI
jgi:molybdopterin molybdotransferase/putative molybdopterin biosynthesis protein